jgi:hypothetical protein
LLSTKWKFRNDQALWVIPKALAREPSSPAIAHLVDYFDLEFEPLWQTLGKKGRLNLWSS